jgi:hypothetical protein
MLIGQYRCADNLREFFFPFDQVEGAIIARIGFQLKEPSETFLLEKNRREGETRRHTAYRLTRSLGRNPGIENLSVPSVFFVLAGHLTHHPQIHRKGPQ